MEDACDTAEFSSSVAGEPGNSVMSSVLSMMYSHGFDVGVLTNQSKSFSDCRRNSRRSESEAIRENR